MKSISTFVFTILSSTFLFGQSLQNKLEDTFKQTTNNPLIHQACLAVKSEDINTQLNYGNLSQNTPLTSEHPFYTASIGKMFTAVSIGLLHDQNKLEFSDPIVKYLPKEITNQLHVYKETDYSQQITIAHLLQHTSGLADYFEDPTITGLPNVIDQLFVFPNKFWEPTDLINFYKANMSPLFPPGKGYHYTDTEFILLGLIVENISGVKLHQFIKQQILEPTSMNHTYMHLRSEPIQNTKSMADFYVESQNIAHFKSLSADWAGGGMVSTAEDLILFINALYSNKILKESTLKSMQNWVQESPGFYYGFGLRKIAFQELSPNYKPYEIVGHSGITGSFLYYCPQLNITISGSLNQTETLREALQLVYEVLDLYSANLTTLPNNGN